MENRIKFDFGTSNTENLIKVIGVGGGGSNAVNHMYVAGIKDVDFMICNTDAQALNASPVLSKVQLGSFLTEGRGAGSLPEIGKKSAEENIDEVMSLITEDTKMVFITAGMGGGTGTGAAPVIAAECMKRRILTVGIVTMPFKFEGKKRRLQAEEGLAEMKANVDCLVVISNEKIREIYGDLTITNAFSKADNVLQTAAKGIAEIITVTGYVNVDFADVETVVKGSGRAIMGTGVGEGDNRAFKAAQDALRSPLLNDNSIAGAKHILLNISSGNNEVTMDEITEITDFIEEEAGSDVNVIWGNCVDDTLGDSLSVTIIATGFEGQREMNGMETHAEKKPTVFNLDAPVKQEVRNDFEERPTPTVAPKQENRQEKIVHDLNSPVLPKSNELELSTSWSENLGTPENKKENEATMEWEVQAKKVVEAPRHLDTIEDNLKQSREKLMQLKNMSTYSANSKASIENLEDQPAYLRRNADIKNEKTSTEEPEVSRYTVNATSFQRPVIRPHNPYLHDNVD